MARKSREKKRFRTGLRIERVLIQTQNRRGIYVTQSTETTTGPIGFAFPAFASETRNHPVWSRVCVVTDAGLSRWTRNLPWSQEPINTSATSTPKAVKHQEQIQGN